MAMRFDDEREAPQDEPEQTMRLFDSKPADTGRPTPPPSPTPPPHTQPDSSTGGGSSGWSGATSSYDDRPPDSNQGSNPDKSTQRPTSSSRTPTGTSDLTLPIYPGQLVSVGKYRLTEMLGKGGFGEVWRAEHVELGEARAIKVLYPQLSQQADFLSRFRREAKMMEKLKDPCAVVVHDYETGQVPFIVMELVHGRTVRDILKDARESSSPSHCGVIPLDLVSRILKQLCGVLEKARAIGLVHRDLKPENLMLLDGCPVGQEELKVLDFGIAKITKGSGEATDPTCASNLTNPDSVLPLCTPAYASPEQAASNAVDHRSDLYTVGVILYELLTGRVPFMAPSGVMGSIPRAMSVLTQQMEKPALAPSLANPEAHIPPAIDEVVLKLLAKAPQDRYQTPTELWEAFSHAMDPSRPVPLPTSTPPPPPPSPPSWRKLAIAASLLVVTLASVAGGAIWWGRSPGKTESTPPSEPLAALKDLGYTPALQATVVGGWPTVIERADGKLYNRVAEGRYLPSGYAAAQDAHDAGDGWPDQIERVEPDGSTIDPARRATFIRIPGTTFVMGKNESEAPWHPAHEVEMTGYYIQQTEVPNREVDAYHRDKLKGLGLIEWREDFDEKLGELKAQQVPDAEVEAGELPAVNLSWRDAQGFARWCRGDLPTEAQWELACFSGPTLLKTPYPWGNDEPDPGLPTCHVNKIVAGPVRVDTAYKDKSPRGVIGLAGNVREWCRDTLATYSRGRVANPCVTAEGPRVLRGSSFMSMSCLAIHERENPGAATTWDRNGDIGFRIVIEDCPQFVLK